MKHIFFFIFLLVIPACEITDETDQLIKKQLNSDKIYNNLILGLTFGQTEAEVNHLLDSLTTAGIIHKNVLSDMKIYDYPMNLAKDKAKPDIEKMQMSLRFRESPDTGLYYLRLSTKLLENNDENKSEIVVIRDKLLKKLKKEFGSDNWIEDKPDETRDEGRYEVKKTAQALQVKGNRLITIEVNEFNMLLSEGKERSNISGTITFTDLLYTEKLKEEKEKSEEKQID